jgi:glutathione S-transferase
MPVVLHHHPFTRAANAVWMLEEVGVDYELRYVDIRSGAQKKPEILALNPMGKLPILVDGETVVTELAAIGLYLADRYAAGKLAPPLDDPARGTYLRWSFFSVSVIEPGAMAKASGWACKPSQVGWGTEESRTEAIERALSAGPFLLGDRFTMADVVFGGTLSYMLGAGTLSGTPATTAYVERLRARPAYKRAEARNAEVTKDQSLGRS